MLGNNCCYERHWIVERIKLLRSRLQPYLDREQAILSTTGVKSYTIGPRSLTRFDTSLKDVQDAIKKLEDEILCLEGLLHGIKPRRVQGIVPRDW